MCPASLSFPVKGIPTSLTEGGQSVIPFILRGGMHNVRWRLCRRSVLNE